MLKKFLFLIVLIGLLSCLNPRNENEDNNNNTLEETASLMMHTDSTDIIGAPALIQSVDNGFIVFDGAYNTFTRFDFQGNKLFSFGKKGKGPGEFLSMSGFKKFKDVYLVFDYRNAKILNYRVNGEFIEEVGLDSDYFPILSVSVEAIEPDRFVMPSLGKEGSLLMDIDRKNNRVQYFGDSIGDYVEHFNPGKINQAITSHKIPSYMLNMVSLSSNQTGFFSFQQTTALLEKYSLSRELIWQKKIETPALDGLFDRYFEKNIARIKKGKPARYTFAYANDMEASEKGVSILLNLTDDQPVTVFWISNDGQNSKVITFDGIETQPGQFSISEQRSQIFFTNYLEGTIYRAKWPL